MAKRARGVCGGMVWRAWLALIIVSLAPAGALAQSDGSAEDLIDYVVVEGDTCGRIARRLFGDGRRYDVLHAYNPDMGPPPHRLVPGTVLRVPRAPGEPEALPDAHVTARERIVSAHPDDSPAWREATLGLPLFRGWHVSTAERSSAELTFADTSVLALREDTLVIIFGDTSRRVRRGGTEARVEHGSLRTALGALRGTAGGGSGNQLRLVTPSAQAELRGGSAVVSVDDAGTSRLSAHEGDVTLSDPSGRGRTRVPEGMGSSVATGARPTAPRPLPAAPSMAPGARHFVGLAGRGADLSGSWQRVTDARTYRVELARQASGRDVAMAIEVPATVTRFEVHGVPAGRYFLRLATIDADFFESRPSAPVELWVEEVSVQGLDGAALPLPAIDPTDDAPPPAALPAGARMMLPDGVRCGDRPDALVLRDGETPSCTDAAGEAVGLPSYTVLPLTVASETTSLARGSRGPITIRSAQAGVAIPEGATLRATGLLLDDVHIVDGEARAEVFVPEDAPSAARIEVLAADGELLATLAVTVLAAPAPSEEPAPEAPVEAPAPPTRRAMAAPFHTPFASMVGLRAHDERGVTLALSTAVRDEGADGARARGAFEAAATFFSGQLRLALALPVDLAGLARAPEPWRRGSADIVLSGGWLFLGEREPISILLDVTAWIPAGGASQLTYVRLIPSIELAIAFAPGLALRTRQSLVIDLAEVGARRWASAYGLDLQLAGPLGLVLEADLAIGDELLASPIDVAGGVALTLDLGLVGMVLGGRFGALSGGAFAPAELHAGIRGTLP